MVNSNAIATRIWVSAYGNTIEGSWAYKEIVEKGLAQRLAQGLEQGMERGLEQGLERGLEQGLEKGLQQGKIQNQRQTLRDYVQIRFPELVTLAVERAGGVEDLETLRQMTVALFNAQTVERARLVLLEEHRTDNTPS